MTSIWNSALNILARREHSRAELKAKLNLRFPDAGIEEIESVLDRLVESGLQSDDRFAEMWFRYQLTKQRGPNRICLEARSKGISSLVQHLIDDPELDWFELALQCGRRKFGHIETMAEKAKAYRFLAYRGFESDSIRYVLDELMKPE